MPNDDEFLFECIFLRYGFTNITKYNIYYFISLVGLFIFVVNLTNGNRTSPYCIGTTVCIIDYSLQV